MHVTTCCYYMCRMHVLSCMYLNSVGNSNRYSNVNRRGSWIIPVTVG